MKLVVTTLKPTTKGKEKTKTQGTSKLPSDKYTPMIEPVELQISDTAKLVFSVSRMGADGLPHLDIRTHVETEQYTGPTKKGINFDVEMLLDFMEIVNDINKKLEAKGV